MFFFHKTLNKKKEIYTMSQKPKTRVLFVLDKSGSMGRSEEGTIMGLNEQIQQTRIIAKTLDVRCSFITFNADVFDHFWDIPASELQEAKVEDYKPEGGTSYMDALGYGIQKLLSTADPETDKETSYLVIGVSDGDTNSDRHYDEVLFNEMRRTCEATKRWTFTWMGHDKEKLEKFAQRTGMNVKNMAVWNNSTIKGAVNGFKNQRKRLAKFYDERAEGLVASCNYASDELGLADFSEEEAGLHKVLSVQQEANNVAEVPATSVTDLLAKLPQYSYHDLAAGQGAFASNRQVVWTSNFGSVTNLRRR